MSIKDEVLNRFCDIYEGREDEITQPGLVYGDLCLIADDLDITVSEVSEILKDAME